MALCSEAISSFRHCNIIRAPFQILCNYLASVLPSMSASFSVKFPFMLSEMAIIVPHITSLNCSIQHINGTKKPPEIPSCVLFFHTGLDIHPWIDHCGQGIKCIDWFKSIRYQSLKNMNYLEGKLYIWGSS